jgi:hypothetical protein
MATNDATMNRLLPLKTMLDGGIHLAFGCDVPASLYQEPKWAFHGAALRRSVQTGTVFNPGQKLTAREALWIHTMGSAYASFADSTTGSLEPGKLADLVIWSHDLYTMSPTDLDNLAAEMTIVGGKIEYDAGLNPVVSVKARDNRRHAPENHQLFQNYPNPFNPSTTIRFRIASSARVKLVIRNTLGERVRTLIDGWTSAGLHSVDWDGLDDAGKPASGGLYLMSIESNGAVEVKKGVLLK